MITVQIEVTGSKIEHVQTWREDRMPETKCYYHITPASSRRLVRALKPAKTRSITRLGDRTNRITKDLA